MQTPSSRYRVTTTILIILITLTSFNIQAMYCVWDLHLPLNLLLLNKVASVLQDDVRVFLPDLVPKLLKAMSSDRHSGAAPAGTVGNTSLVLGTLSQMSRYLEEYLFLIVAPLTALVENKGVSE